MLKSSYEQKFQFRPSPFLGPSLQSYCNIYTVTVLNYYCCYYYFVSIVISLFCLETVPPYFVFKFIYISYKKSEWFLINSGLPVAHVCVKCFHAHKL